MKTTIAFAIAFALCLLFFAQGYLFIRQVGIQQDEVLFASPILQPVEAAGWLGNQPIMLMNYAGSLKTLVYREIFRVAPPNARSVRMPVLLLGTATVFLLFLFFRMTMGAAAALIATALLAVDPLFVITTVLDWGIDAVQHFLAAAALPLFLLFHRRGDTRFLKAACLLCGVALWDKVTFVWFMTGLAAGAWVAFNSEVRALLTWRNVRLAAAWMALGAAPLIYFNLANPALTIRTSGGVGAPGIDKAQVLRASLDGSILFGWLTRSAGDGQERAPQTRVERAGVAVSRATGGLEWHGLLFACLASLAMWRNRAVRFCAVAFAAGWLAMLPFAMGGGGAHHIVLLWPWPHMMVAAALCAIPRMPRVAACAIAAPLVLWSALVTNEYYARIVTRGNVANWSDAIEPLRARLSVTRTGGILPVDWGIAGPLRCLGRGILPVKPWGIEQARIIAENPSFVFVRYVDRQGRDPERLAVLRGLGFEEDVVADVPDRNGRPIYRVFRYKQP